MQLCDEGSWQDRFPTFDAKGDAYEYLRGFERVCEDNNVPKTSYCQLLRILATGGILQEVLCQLPADKHHYFETLKSLLKLRTGLCSEQARQIFRAIQRGRTESFMSYANAIHKKFETWMELESVTTIAQMKVVPN